MTSRGRLQRKYHILSALYHAIGNVIAIVIATAAGFIARSLFSFELGDPLKPINLRQVNLKLRDCDRPVIQKRKVIGCAKALAIVDMRSKMR